MSKYEVISLFILITPFFFDFYWAIIGIIFR